MSATVGLQIGKAIFDILKNSNNVTSVSGMSTSVIQPAPLLRNANTDAAVIYEISSVNPVNVKRQFRVETAPLYNVSITIECLHKVYHDSIILADNVSQALQTADASPYNNVKVDGFNLTSMQESYDKARRYYSKLLTFDARVLL